MAEYGYQCFMLTKDTLVPVHVKDWWYSHMDSFTRGYWGNGLCSIKGSNDMQMLWRMYHSDNLKLINAEPMVLTGEPIVSDMYTKDDLSTLFNDIITKGSITVCYLCFLSCRVTCLINLPSILTRRSTME